MLLLALHKPLDVAEQLGTLDIMTNGKLIFGCGVGYRDIEFAAFGTSKKERASRFEENLAAVKRLWTEETVTMKGSHFELIEAGCSAKPVQKPTPADLGRRQRRRGYPPRGEDGHLLVCGPQ